MSADKRRAARIQGGINQHTQPKQQTAFTSQQNYGRRSSQNRLSTPENAGKRPNLRQPESYAYTETHQKIREKPEVKFIETEGKHIISVEPSGESVVYFFPNFIDKELCNELFQTLLETIKWQESYIRIHDEQYKSPRLVKWFGPLPYTYSGTVLPSDKEWHPAVDCIYKAVLHFLKNELKCYDEFNSVLLNLYRNEHDSVSWHSDDEMSMGVCPTIASVSLGETRMFRLRKKPPPEEYGNFEYMQHYNIPLISGSLLIMDGCTQKDWQHSVLKEYHSRKPRINLTFRTIFPTNGRK